MIYTFYIHLDLNRYHIMYSQNMFTLKVFLNVTWIKSCD